MFIILLPLSGRCSESVVGLVQHMRDEKLSSHFPFSSNKQSNIGTRFVD